MKRFLVVILFLAANNIDAQTDSSEVFRQKGYQAKLDGDYKLSVKYNKKILEKKFQ